MEKQLEKPMNFEQAASESLGLAYHLIPPESLRRLSRIFLEGIEKYPGKAVNAKNMKGAVGNTYWQVERFNHAVDHLLKWGQGDTTEDHLAKVMWFCSVMIEARRLEELIPKEEKSPNLPDTTEQLNSLLTKGEEE